MRSIFLRIGRAFVSHIPYTSAVRRLLITTIMMLGLASGNGWAKERIKAPTSGGEAMPLKADIASVNALLLHEVAEGEYGGSVSKLTATVVPGRKGKAMSTMMNQRVEEAMEKAFEAVNRAIYLKYDAWPQGKSLELGFEDKYGQKDGPSAALGYGLILESLVSGRTIRPELACTGDMNTDRSIQPIGGVADKIRAASKAGCKHILIPVDNVTAVEDMVVDGKLKLATSIQIIAVSTLEEALQVAFTDPDADIAEALEAYDKAKEQVMEGGARMLQAPAVFDLIKQTGRTLPNHVSARLLALASKNRLPKRYSVAGSFARIEKAIRPLLDAVERGDDTGFAAHSRNDGHSLAMKNLRSIDHKLHRKMRDYNAALTTYLEALRSAATQKSGITKGGLIWNRLKNAEREFDVERRKLLSDPEIKDQRY